MRLPVIALAASLAAAGCIDLVGADARYVERETKHFSTLATPEINLDTFDGAIEIRAWEKPDVDVVIEKRAVTREAAATIEIRAEQSGNRITVEAKAPKSSGIGFHFNDNRSARLIVSAPAASNLVARSGDGSIDIERISGRIELRSGDGSIRGRDLSGEVKVHTGDGSIRLDGIKGSLDLDTGDGSIVASGTLTSVHARSGDGGVTIRADGNSVPAGEWEITTGDGSITLELPDAFNANLDAHTGDGGVSIHDLSVSSVSGKIGKNNLRGQLGAGGPLVRLRTGDGGITLRRSRPAEAP
jgi:putative adhesin